MSENPTWNLPQVPYAPDAGPESMTSHEVVHQPSQAEGEDEEPGESQS
ncbi:hypothetical protein [Streptomyces incanus]|uniref:Uncharacterized protein n=1 Tax=Streptomyces incanus TaxID=887453 RepID=A0ABW0XGZ7_9ACTN